MTSAPFSPVVTEVRLAQCKPKCGLCSKIMKTFKTDTAKHEREGGVPQTLAVRGGLQDHCSEQGNVLWGLLS